MGGWGAPQDRPGPENKVTFSAQLPHHSWLRGVWGCSQPSSGIYSEHIVPGHNKEGLRPFFSRVFGLWRM